MPQKKSFFSFTPNLENEIRLFFKNKNSEDVNEKIKNNLNQLLAMPDAKLHSSCSNFPKHILFLLSEKCNLNCTYCYAHDSHCASELSIEDIKFYLDYYFSFRVKRRSISFLGGGEPFLSWDLIKFAVIYAKEKAKEFDEKIHFGITTNMTLFDEEKIDFIKKNHISINASFDILPEVQDSQRVYLGGKGTFNVVNNNLKKLIENKIYPTIRTTITVNNVHLMPDMIKFVQKNYPQLKKVHFEHVSDIDNEKSLFYKDFVDYYFKAFDLAKETLINLTNSAVGSIFNYRQQFCSKEFCVTADNNIIKCHRVSNTNSTIFNDFCYGNKTDDSITFFKKLEDEYPKPLPEKCQNCFAKFNCAGGCEYNRSIMTTKQFDQYCDFVRQMIISTMDYVSKT